MIEAQGWQGWDDYADFYDWENAQTLDRRDVRFWQDDGGARRTGRCWSLGAAPGASRFRSRARARASSASIDRPKCSRHARRRARRADTLSIRARMVRSDIRFASIPSIGAVRSRDGAVRHPAVARPRIRSQGHAGIRRRRAARAAASSVSISSPICRSGRNTATGSFSRLAPRRQVAHHAGGIRAAGSREEADDVRPAIHRARAAASERSRRFSLVFRTLHGAADDQAARARRVPGYSRPGRLQADSPGIRAPTCG